MRGLNEFIAIAAIALTLACSVVRAQDHHGDDPHAGPVMNYRAIDPKLSTGGHFTRGGLNRITNNGVEVVIDLREEQPKGSVAELKRRGIRKIHVPVVWENPRQEDFKAFSAALGEHRDSKVLVQCQANYRASAMTYLYRVIHEDTPEAEAREDLHAVWKPNATWRKFMKQTIAAAKD